MSSKDKYLEHSKRTEVILSYGGGHFGVPAARQGVKDINTGLDGEVIKRGSYRGLDRVRKEGSRKRVFENLREIVGSSTRESSKNTYSFRTVFVGEDAESVGRDSSEREENRARVGPSCSFAPWSSSGR